MIPIEAENMMDIEEITMPSKDFGLNLSNNSIGGYVDELEAMDQVVYKILNTERYEHLIYDWDYGVEFNDLFGEPIYYVVPEVKRRITEALTQDDRIDDVTDFDFTYEKDKIICKFIVETIYGNLEAESEVNI